MRVIIGGLALGLTVVGGTAVVQAQEWNSNSFSNADARYLRADRHGRSFKRIATVPNYINNSSRDDETVSEIVAANADGDLLVYTDAETEAIGLVDIKNPKYPMPVGTIALGGEPTSVSVLGNEYALVGVNTTDSLTDPTGSLAVIDIHSRTVVAEIDLGGQPDSISVSRSLSE